MILYWCPKFTSLNYERTGSFDHPQPRCAHCLVVGLDERYEQSLHVSLHVLKVWALSTSHVRGQITPLSAGYSSYLVTPRRVVHLPFLSPYPKSPPEDLWLVIIEVGLMGDQQRK